MKELVEQVKLAGAKGSDNAIAAHLKGLGYTGDPVQESEARELAIDFNGTQVEVVKAIAPVQSTQMARARGRKARKTEAGDRGSITQVSEQVEQYERSILAGIDAFVDDKSSAIAQRIIDLPAEIVGQVNGKVAGSEADPDQFRAAAVDTLGRIGICL